MANAADPLPPTDAFMPHGMCYLWRPDVLALHIVSDALIAIAYFSIPFTLLYFVRRRRDLEFSWMFVCFAIFIVACGTTHLMDIWVIWHPVYWLSGAIKAVTAMASIPTAILLVRLVPTALKLPNPAALRSAYVELEREVARRRRTEEDLRAANAQLKIEASRGRLAAIVESSDDAIFSENLEGLITSWNHGAEKVFGYADSEVMGRSAEMLFPPERAGGEAAILRRVRLGERIAPFEGVRKRKGGERIDVSASVSPMRDATGTVVGASKIVRDISERKRADEALAEQAKILDLAQVIVRDLTGRILRWSRGSEKLYGFSTEEALGAISHELLRTRFPEPLEAINAKFEREGVWEGELAHHTRDGTEINVVSVWALHRDGQGGPPRVLESNLDVTERKRAEARVAAQLGRLDLLNTITRAIGERQDLRSIFRVAIGTLEDQLPVDFGCLCLFRPPDVLVVSGVGVKSHDLALQLNLTDQALVPIDVNGLSRCVRGQLVYEPDMSAVSFAFPQRLAGVGLNAMVAAPLLVENNVFGALIVARRAAHSFSSGECEFLGQLAQHIALAAHQAQLYGALETAYEDLRHTQQAVMRQEKLRVLGQMASGIAHDINNALSPAALYVEALLDRDLGPSETKDYLVIIQRAIDGVAQTVARMKEFYSQRDPQLAHAPVALNEIVKQVIDLTRARWNSMPQESGRVICVDTDLAPDLPAIVGNQSEISDALTNLILNAVDAMPEGGRITVRSRTAADHKVQLDVADTGIGMDEATRNRCLELFFTTKGVRGTGLGLAMVYGAVERHGGELQIESGLGAGTNIRLIFPAAAAPAPTGIMTTQQPAAQQPLRILVIDDDPIILKSMRDILELCGHFIGVADGGRRGIDIFRAAHERGEPFEVVITDLGMPHVDGRAVAAAVKSLEPKTPVILLTGWGHRMLAENDAPANIDRVMGKPPRLALLRVTLAELTLVEPA
jgi:PAS domain S-box-containing protein